MVAAAGSLQLQRSLFRTSTWESCRTQRQSNGQSHHQSHLCSHGYKLPSSCVAFSRRAPTKVPTGVFLAHTRSGDCVPARLTGHAIALFTKCGQTGLRFAFDSGVYEQSSR